MSRDIFLYSFKEVNPFLNEVIKVDRSENLKKLSSDRKNVNFIDFIKSNRKYSQDPKIIRYINSDVDKELNPSKVKPPDYNPMKSVFSYCDFRNNVLTKEQHEYFDSKVSQLPKQFLNWDDGTKFNPRYRRDK